MPTLPRAPDVRPVDLDPHPARHLRDATLAKFGPKVYSATARLVAFLIVSGMQKDDSGSWSAWPGIRTLARLSGLSLTTVWRCMTRELIDGPRPLFLRQRNKQVIRKGVPVNRGTSFVYLYAWEPELLAQARDLARSQQEPRPPKPKRRSNLPGRRPAVDGSDSQAVPLTRQANAPAVRTPVVPEPARVSTEPMKPPTTTAGVPPEVLNRTAAAVALFKDRVNGRISEVEYDARYASLRAMPAPPTTLDTECAS